VKQIPVPVTEVTYTRNGHFGFLEPLLGNICCSSWAHWKSHSEFPMSHG